MNLEQAKFVEQKIKNWDAIFYIESSSNTDRSQFKSYSLKSGDIFLKKNKSMFDSVIRIGGVPTTRFWRNLEDDMLPVMSFSHNEFSGLAREHKYAYPLEALSSLGNDFTHSKMNEILKKDEELFTKLNQVIEKYPHSELSLLKSLSHLISKNDQVFVGNSLPIRELDLIQFSNCPVYSNRGVNGIDGQVSTALGLCDENQMTWCIVGDLTALYDMQSLWAIYKHKRKNIKIIVINNNGGKIFEPLFNNEAFENQHQLNFSSWAKMFGLSYKSVKSADDLSLKDIQIVEVSVDEKESRSLVLES